MVVKENDALKEQMKINIVEIEKIDEKVKSLLAENNELKIDINHLHSQLFSHNEQSHVKEELTTENTELVFEISTLKEKLNDSLAHHQIADDRAKE